MIRCALLLCLFWAVLPVSAALADDEALRELMAKNSADYAPAEEKQLPALNVTEGLHYQSKPEGVHADDGNPFAPVTAGISVYGNNYGNYGPRGMPWMNPAAK